MVLQLSLSVAQGGLERIRGPALYTAVSSGLGCSVVEDSCTRCCGSDCPSRRGVWSGSVVSCVARSGECGTLAALLWVQDGVSRVSCGAGAALGGLCCLLHGSGNVSKGSGIDADRGAGMDALELAWMPMCCDVTGAVCYMVAILSG